MTWLYFPEVMVQVMVGFPVVFFRLFLIKIFFKNNLFCIKLHDIYFLIWQFTNFFMVLSIVDTVFLKKESPPQVPDLSQKAPIYVSGIENP